MEVSERPTYAKGKAGEVFWGADTLSSGAPVPQAVLPTLLWPSLGKDQALFHYNTSVKVYFGDLLWLGQFHFIINLKHQSEMWRLEL